MLSLNINQNSRKASYAWKANSLFELDNMCVIHIRFLRRLCTTMVSNTSIINVKKARITNIRSEFHVISQTVLERKARIISTNSTYLYNDISV